MSGIFHCGGEYPRRDPRRDGRSRAQESGLHRCSTRSPAAWRATPAGGSLEFMMMTNGSKLESSAPDRTATLPRRARLTSFRECRRTWRALARGESDPGRGWSRTELTDDPPISKTRAVTQVALSAVLVPACLWALFGPRELGAPARETASALLGAIVAFWLKD